MDENDALQKAINRAKAGNFREYWLQLYIKENYKKLGFESIQGPFDIGPDFKGVYKGRYVVVEAEREASNFIVHGHDVNQIDMLIVLKDNTSRTFRKMSPAEWTLQIPKEIIVVDAEDFVKLTHEMRKAYAIKKGKEKEMAWAMLPFMNIRQNLNRLWQLVTVEDIGEDSIEDAVFAEALTWVTIEYIQTYNLNLEEYRWDKPDGVKLTKLDYLVNDLMKSRRDVEDFTKDEKEFIGRWLTAIRDEYGSRL